MWLPHFLVPHFGGCLVELRGGFAYQRDLYYKKLCISNIAFEEEKKACSGTEQEQTICHLGTSPTMRCNSLMRAAPPRIRVAMKSVYKIIGHKFAIIACPEVCMMFGSESVLKA